MTFLSPGKIFLASLVRKRSRAPRVSSRSASPRSFTPGAWFGLESLEGRVLLSFSAPASYAAGTAASAVVVGDFNGDTVNDIAELNSSTSSVSVLLGNGDGTLQAGVSSPAGGTGTKMTVADFNHDGKLDIVTNQGYYLSLLRGNGDGTFQAGGTYYVGAYANDVEAGDVNHDGFDDLVTASFSYGGTTQLLLNDGLGGFLPTRNLAIGPTGQAIEIGDINGDGNADLVEQGGYNTSVLIGAGDGTFRSMPYMTLAGIAQDVHLGDFNHDGMDDLAVTNGSVVSIYAGNSLGAFDPPTSISLGGATRLRIGDVNGDGNNDIVANNGLVVLGRGDGGFFVPTAYGAPSGAAIALGDLNKDGGTDLVSAASLSAGGGINVALNGNNDVQLLAGATQLQVSAPDNVLAGSPFAVTVTALDAGGNVVSGFQGSVAIVGAPGTQPVYATFTAGDNGVHTVADAAKFFTAGSGTYSVMSPFLPSASGTVNVLGAAAARFTVVSQATSVAGDTTSVTVSAFDAYGNQTSGYLGTLHFTSSDVQAGLPGDYTFTLADAGVHTFDLVLKTAGGQTVTASDAVRPTLTGSSGPVTVTPSMATALSLTGGGGFMGSVNAVKITARDAYGNAAVSYGGVVHLATSDASSTTSGDAALVNGVGTFTVTPMTLGAQTLTATDVSGSLAAGSETINVTPGWGARFVATSLPATVAGQPQSTTLTVFDAFGNVSTVFSGYVAVASTDPQAPTHLVYLSPSDAGVKTIPVTLYTAGTQAVTIYDYFNPGVTFTQAGISVAPAAASSISVTPLHGTTAGVAQDVTVTARDIYGNVAPDYRGTLHFQSSDIQAGLPADYTFTAADAGTHLFSVTYKTAGGQDITVSDPVNPAAFGYYQRDNMITPAALSSFAFKGASISNTTAGSVFGLTVSAADAYGNTINGYTGTAIFASTDGQAALPSSYTFTAADAGSHTFGVALKTAGTQTITAADSANGSISGSTSTIVKAAAASKVAVSTAATATAGTSQSVIVTVTDAYGNVSTNYTGAVKFSSSDAQAVLPAGYSFTNKDAGVHSFNVTFKTAGSQSITVADTLNAAVTATQTGIAVTVATVPVASFSVTGFPATTAGAAKSFTVTARDAAGNVVTGYTGAVTFSSSDVKAGLPASYTFTAADSGVHVFTATLFTAGTQSLTVKDAMSSAVIGSQTGIAVTAGVATQFKFSTPASVTQGVGFKFTLTALDAYGNVATGYRGKVHLSSTDSKGGTSDYTFSSSDNGVHVFSYTFNTLGLQTLTITDTSNSTLTGKATLNVLAK